MAFPDDYFIDPDSNDIRPLLTAIAAIHAELSPNLTKGEARVRGGHRGKYLEHLSEFRIPESEQAIADVMREAARFCGGAVRWHHPGTLININPPAMMPSIAAVAYASIFNPNLAMDVPAGGLALAEMVVVKLIAELAGWDWKDAHGLFTFGGKATNMYGVKVGLHSISPQHRMDGQANDAVVFSNVYGHPCHIEVCDWLGLGRNRCIRLPVDSDGRLNLRSAEQAMRQALERGQRIACIILNGGTPLQNAIDPIAEVLRIRSALCSDFGLTYTPHVHLDSVIGWAWLFFKGYDFDLNPHGFSQRALDSIRLTTTQIAEISGVDSFGADFHKTGFCPYPSSAFFVRPRAKLEDLALAEHPSFESLEFGNYAPFLYTLESSRPATSALSAFVALTALGTEGFQKLVGGLVQCGQALRDGCGELEGFDVANPEATGFACMCVVFPPNTSSRFDLLDDLTESDAISVAAYNHKFYLFLLERAQRRESPLLADYVSGYSQLRNGVKMGAIKLFPMSPFLDREGTAAILAELRTSKAAFDRVSDTFEVADVPYKPKPFVTR